jgi:cytochrome c oxidase subunit 3
LPAIITPPDLERRLRRSEENDGGHGRRPPNGRDLKRTGGGGDNDNGNDSPSRPRRPGERLTTYRLGLFFALGAVVMFFVGIVSVFFHGDSDTHIDAYNRIINNWLPATIPPILWLNTAVLLVSAVTMEVARRHMFHQIDAMEEWFGLGKPTSRRALPWLIATLILGSLFLAGQIVAWHQLALQRISFNSSGSGAHAFYIITYAHAIHLTAGIAALIAAVIGLFALLAYHGRSLAHPLRPARLLPVTCTRTRELTPGLMHLAPRPLRLHRPHIPLKLIEKRP